VYVYIFGSTHSVFLLEVQGKGASLVTKESSKLAGHYHPNEYSSFILKESGLGSVVSNATAKGLDDPGIESLWGRDFPHLSRPALGAHRSSCTMGAMSFPE
jgi:hypothetical protein